MWIARNTIEGIHQQNQVISLLIDLIQKRTKNLRWLILFLLRQFHLACALKYDLPVHRLEEIIGSGARREFAQIQPDKNMMAQIFFNKLLNCREAHAAQDR